MTTSMVTVIVIATGLAFAVPVFMFFRKTGVSVTASGVATGIICPILGMVWFVSAPLALTGIAGAFIARLANPSTRSEWWRLW